MHIELTKDAWHHGMAYKAGSVVDAGTDKNAESQLLAAGHKKTDARVNLTPCIEPPKPKAKAAASE